MKLSINSRALAGLLLLSLVGTILLTPAGFETRPVAAIHPLGLAVLLLIFVAVALNVAALALLVRRPRTAAMLAAFGPFLFLPALLVDQTGNFSRYGPPLRITAVEYVQFLIELLVLFFAARIVRESRVPPPPTAPPASEGPAAPP